MAPPTVHLTTRRLYDALGVGFTDRDADLGYPLLEFLDGTGELLGEVDDIVRDSDDGPGWSLVFDIDRIPIEYLGYLAQFIGADVPANVSDNEKRARVKNAEGFKRGTRGAIEQAAKSLLTGEQRVRITERDGSAYQLTVRTYSTETPDPDLVEAEILKQKPAGIVLTYEVLVGELWGTVKDNFATWQDLKDEFATWADLRNWQEA